MIIILYNILFLLKLKFNLIIFFNIIFNFFDSDSNGDWGLGIGDWGFGDGE